MQQNTSHWHHHIILSQLTRSLREPGGPCTKSMEISESRMERVKAKTSTLFSFMDTQTSYCTCGTGGGGGGTGPPTQKDNSLFVCNLFALPQIEIFPSACPAPQCQILAPPPPPPPPPLCRRKKLVKIIFWNFVILPDDIYRASPGLHQAQTRSAARNREKAPRRLAQARHHHVWRRLSLIQRRRTSSSERTQLLHQGTRKGLEQSTTEIITVQLDLGYPATS